MKYIDYEKQVQYDTLSKAAIRNQIFTETLSEEMRILYVALTRAKEKLIITGIKKDYEKQKEKLLQQIERYQKQDKKINPILVKKYIKYIDWILLVYFYEQTNMENMAELKIYTREEVLDFCEKIEIDNINILEMMEKQEVNKTEIERIEDMVNHIYPFELSTKIPTKTSVTKIKQGEEEQLEITFPSPKFAQEEESIKLTGAQKGTLLHLCMQRLDEKKDYDLGEIQKLVNDLVKREIITPKELENINPIAILKFTQSKIWKDMNQAKEIQREKPFYITLPAKEVYQEESAESILVQGIIDLYYINKENELILVDYKTDFVQTEMELVNKYEKQLVLYKRALEESLGKEVNHIYIYSTFLEKEIEVLKK